ncbi:zinc finger protein GAI-ASSOCIATED FACTOR 1-like [Abrus precatorius]|uniref:Zinc finger protein GAI-ASSOCIATED FACTOR 1-like n=1 Tax=Abrus precatorius TaxID=3816 RepID=A0A8B8MKP6_ABRPR|nr:zinc finger protein GAI-ASSOCIATED FACTOR 1-like [Abrus precatorius]
MTIPISKFAFWVYRNYLLIILNPTQKKRNLPGRPDPDAEVIALSPKTLLATNRFVCEICNKGFQRDQNLQLHRRGHNLPWKLRQGKGKEARKKVYVCPEPSCVHNKPCRALGDLTGIKKHFCRKHGEKKWSCQRCAKKYAVQSDWKAHMKTCGIREYRCHCGNFFSRRDKFIMHKAFCDALANEGALPTIGGGDESEERNSNSKRNVPLASSPPLTPSMSLVSAAMSVQSSGILENPMNKGATGTSSTSTSIRVFASIFASSTLCCSKSSSITFSNHMTASSTATPIPTCLSLSKSESSHYTSSSQAPALSATALLQKAAQMGAAASNASLRLQSLGLATTSSSSPEDETISAMLHWNIKHAKQHAKQDNNHSVPNLMVDSQTQPLTRDLLGLSVGGNASLSALFPSFGESFDASAKHC